jgi:hypothetical protein
MATAKVLPRYHLVISGGDRSVCQGGGGGVGERVGRGALASGVASKREGFTDEVRQSV